MKSRGERELRLQPACAKHLRMDNFPLPRTLRGIRFADLVSTLATEPFFCSCTIPTRDAAPSRYTLLASHPVSTLAIDGGFTTVDGHTTIASPATSLEHFFAQAAPLPI